MQNQLKMCDCVTGIDRMINEGWSTGQVVSGEQTEWRTSPGKSFVPNEPVCDCQWDIDRMISEGAASGY